jgi:hypothetical protein
VNGTFYRMQTPRMPTRWEAAGLQAATGKNLFGFVIGGHKVV